MLEPGALAAMALAFHTSRADLVAGICHVHKDRQILARHVTTCLDGPLPLEDLLDLDANWMKGQFFYQPEVMFTREIWEKAGGRVQTDLYHSMDYELWLRMAHAGAKLKVIGRPQAYFRAHPDQKTAGTVVGGFRAELPLARDSFQARSGVDDGGEQPDRDQHRDGQPDDVFHSAIEPQATLILRDAIRDIFGHEDAVGTVRILASSDNAALSARARIYNIASQPGEFGQTVQAVAVSKLSREAYLPGLSGLAPNRTNVGIANATGENTVAVLTLWDRNGEPRRGLTVEIPAGGSLVLNDVFTHLGTGPLDGATIHVVASQPFYAWASIVRSDSGDADFVAASGSDK